MQTLQIADKMPQPDPDELARRSLQKIKNKLIVMSGKGGVGKTSVSVNLAIALAARNFKVGLLDIDIHGPDIPRMLGLSGMLSADDFRRIQPLPFSDNLSMVSIESLLSNKDEAIIWRGPMKHNAIRQFIGEVNWGALDFLVIDAPPGTGDEPLTVAQLVKDAQAIIVTTPQEVALADIRKSINFCKTVNMKIRGVIENMSGYTCPHCSKTVEIFGTGGGERTAMAMGLPFLGRIPFDPDMVKCADAGISYQTQHKKSAAAEAYKKIVGQLSNTTAS
jgi:ATP-binding protein involved in chromosome partitioning